MPYNLDPSSESILYICSLIWAALDDDANSIRFPFSVDIHLLELSTFLAGFIISDLFEIRRHFLFKEAGNIDVRLMNFEEDSNFDVEKKRNSIKFVCCSLYPYRRFRFRFCPLKKVSSISLFDFF